MSGPAVEWAMKQELGTSAKLVLVAIAYRAGAEGTAWPSQATVARECGLSIASVKRYLHELKDTGLLSWEVRRRTGRRNDPNVYRLAFADQLPLTGEREEGVTHEPHSPSPVNGSPVHPRTPVPFTGESHSRSPVSQEQSGEPETEPATEHRGRAREAVGARSARVRAVLAALAPTGIPLTVDGPTAAAINGANAPPELVASAYAAARRRDWDPGGTGWLAGQPIRAVIERLDAFVLWQQGQQTGGKGVNGHAAGDVRRISNARFATDHP